MHCLTFPDAVRAVLALVQMGGAHQVVTLNGSMLASASADPDLRAIINDASLVTADGVGVLLAARILGVRLPERVAGIDLVDAVCAEGAGRSLRVFCLGAQPGVAVAAGRALSGRYPGIRIVGTEHGYLQDEDAALALQIRGAAPQLLLVGMGFPRQEQWIAAHLQELGDVVCVGVGGTLDVLARRTRRAPDWMRRAGLEWFFRLATEPRRWRIVAAGPQLLWLAVRARLSRGKKELHRG